MARTGLFSKLIDALDNVINPATSDKQDELIALSDNYATQIVESGSYTYIGKAEIGSATSAASWQVFRIDESSNFELEWADGNDSFDNIWDNHASLSYS